MNDPVTYQLSEVGVIMCQVESFSHDSLAAVFGIVLIAVFVVFTIYRMLDIVFKT